MKAVMIFTISLLFLPDIAAQVPDNDAPDHERLVDDLIGYQDLDVDYEDLYENLVQTLSSPYDLNKVTAEELRSIHILNDDQISGFINYRHEQGSILDIHELQVIPGFDGETISKLLPYVKVNDPSQVINRSLLKRIFSPGHSYLVSRYERTLENKNGFKNSSADNTTSFKGSPDEMYLRFRSALPGDFSIGFTTEKDAGEKIRFNRARDQYGPDFLSYHIQLQNKGKIKNLILGDFQTQFGQGLLLGGAFGLGKGSESVSTTRKSNLGFLPYTSVNESMYLRGGALTLTPAKDINVSVFTSATKRDAASEVSDSVTVTSFQTSGFHRTSTELQNRKKVNELNYGVVMHLQKGKLDAGVIFNATKFSIPVRRKPTPYNQFAFKGSRNMNAGTFINYRMGNISFFSEFAQTVRAGRGLVAGLLISAGKNFDVSMLYRKYDVNFYSFYTNSFSESTQPQNESGLYWGWKYRWNRQYNFTGYADLFTFPWLGFRRYAPSEGYEWLLRANYQPSKKTSVFLQVREESKFRNRSDVSNLYQLAEGLKQNIAMNCDYGIGENLRLKSRFQFSRYLFLSETSEGFTLMQDLSFSFGRFQFTGRHALFDTDNYDNRQYAYENDAWLSYSLPAYSGVGVRNYALIEYTLHKQFTLWVRFARTRVINDDEIGSGPDAIAGNTRNDVKFQARIKF
jgi:hypothetical protein